MTTKVRQRMAAAAVGLATLLAAGLAVSPALASSSYPGSSRSRYEFTTSHSTLYSQGCAAARAGRRGVTILDYGRPAYDRRTRRFGTIDFANHFASNPAITRAAEAFARGYVSCLARGSTHSIALAIGTSNSCSNQDPACCPHRCGHQPPSFSRAGHFLASYVRGMSAYLRNHGLSRWVHASAGDDAEPAWDPAYTNTRDYLRGFAATTGRGFALWDYGSLEPGYWTPAQEYFVAYGAAPAVPFGEIYFPGNASEWEALDRWVVAHTGRQLHVYGVTSQWTRHCRCGFSPSVAYQRMLNALRSNSRTYQRSIPYVTDIYG